MNPTKILFFAVLTYCSTMPYHANSFADDGCKIYVQHANYQNRWIDENVKSILEDKGYTVLKPTRTRFNSNPRLEKADFSLFILASPRRDGRELLGPYHIYFSSLIGEVYAHNLPELKFGAFRKWRARRNLMDEVRLVPNCPKIP